MIRLPHLFTPFHSGLKGKNVPECDSYSQCNQEHLHQVLLTGKLLTEQQEPGVMNKSESDGSQFVSRRDFSNLFELMFNTCFIPDVNTLKRGYLLHLQNKGPPVGTKILY